MNKFNLTLLLLIIILSGCSKDKKEVSLIKETSQELEMITSYNEAYKDCSARCKDLSEESISLKKI